MFKHIDKWMLLLVVMLLTACRSYDEEKQDDDCFLEIYVYAPDRPIVTRSDVGEVMPKEGESTINTLQIWVFKHADGNKVGYLNADPKTLNETSQQMYRMQVAKTFADNPEPVDVYVVANTASVGLSFNEDTGRDDLKAAVLGTNYFGISPKYSNESVIKAVPANGLPMSAIASNQPVYGSFPSLRIGSEAEMTTLQLTRAVSKLRFVLCRKAGEQESSKALVSIDDISLDANQIPMKTNFMPETTDWSQVSYIDKPIAYIDQELLPNDIPEVEDPMAYAYETQTAQDYEDMIDKAIAGTYKANEKDKPLMELGVTYLRESNKQLTGTIKYTYKEGEKIENKTAGFAIAAQGDFLRNHSWIIYAYYMDATIHILTVTHIGMKNWTEDGEDESITVYNW